MTVKFMGSRKHVLRQKGGGFSHVFALPVNKTELSPHTHILYIASRQKNIIIIIININKFYTIRKEFINLLGQQSRTPTCTWCWLRTYDCNIIIEPRETSAFD